ncbi:MAG: type IX secretion system sortase PorU, partial [Cyclobacteriaceae bacterium]
MISLKKIWLLCIGWCFSLAVCAQESVLQTGAWYKFAIEKPGVYKISYDLLRKMGVDPTKIDPQNIKIFGHGGGMLPQSNDVARPDDLTQNAIFVEGETDGVFHKNDYILFYAEGADKDSYDVSRDVFYHQKNLYSDKNFYFLNIGEDAGKRISSVGTMDGNFPLINTFEDYAFHELDEFNVEHSGREWFGEKFGLTLSYTFNLNLSGIASGSPIKIISDVLGQTYTDATFRLLLNNVSVGEQKILPIPNGRYSVKGLHKRDTFSVAAADVNAINRSSQEIKYEFLKGSGFSQGYLDYFLLQVRRNLSLYEHQTIFLSKESLLNPVSTFLITQVTQNVTVWDITDHYDVKFQVCTINADLATFSTQTDQLKKFIVFDNTFPQPVFVSRVENQNIRGLTTPNLLIIAHTAFEGEAYRLAAHREAHDNWSVQVVTTEQVFNEFSSGRQDVSALRDFARHLWDKNPDALKAILLFGKGSYDYKDRVLNNTNFVPTYQSRNSLHPLQTYSSDDYFAFLENGEGNWGESPAQHHTLDVGIGRLPVTTAQEAQNVVDKIIDYDTNQKTFGAWRKKIVFVADDGNTEDGFTSLHQYQADQLANIIEENKPAFDTRKIFMGSYKKNTQPNGETVPGMADDIKRSFDQGALIINFTGHGSEVVWTDERILTDKTIAALTNDKYPFMVTATCEFGRQDDPQKISSAELIVTLKDAGAIGLVTTARPVNATTNFNLNEAFYQSLFEQSSAGYATIGEVFLKTKNNSTSGVANRNFSLIGDPSMVLALPGYSIDVTEMKTATGSDTLKALSTVIAKGIVRGPGGERLNLFNGTVQATLFDKAVEFVTIGRNNPAFAYNQWDNALFRGQATVKDGGFEFTFIMPKNIGYQMGSGKFSLYAYDTGTGLDAKGVNSSINIGGTEADIAADNTPPEIQIFMGDTTFVNGGVTTPDTYLIARISDNNGINISGYGIGNSVLAQLDNDSETFILNDYFITDKDTYRKGLLRFPMLGLTAGKHVLTVKAWDVYNNPAQASIEFLVTGQAVLVIESFGNYPNPFEQTTTLFFTHNRSGDDLQAQLFIYSHAGELVKSSEIFISESQYRINLTELNTLEESGKKLSPGLYLARLIVRSMTNGSKNEQV